MMRFWPCLWIFGIAVLALPDARAQQDGALGGAQLAAVHHWLDAHRHFGMRLEDVTTEQERMELGLQ